MDAPSPAKKSAARRKSKSKTEVNASPATRVSPATPSEKPEMKLVLEKGNSEQKPAPSPSPTHGREHIYIVTSPEMRAASKFKVGFHTGDRDKLLHRYVTALNEVELVMFIRGSLAEEQVVHDRLSPYRVPNHNGKASEWYVMPERVLIMKVIEILEPLASSRSPLASSRSPLASLEGSVQLVDHEEETHNRDRYIGPLKFLHACEDARWDLFREWLSSREYKQDKHIRSKLNRKGEKESQAEAIRWNEAHQWLTCLELMCASTKVPILVVELLMTYCDRRWVKGGVWIEPSEARSIGFQAAKKIDNGPLLAHMQAWGAGVETEAKAEPAKAEPTESEPVKRYAKPGPREMQAISKLPPFEIVELQTNAKLGVAVMQNLASSSSGNREPTTNSSQELASDPRTDSVLIQSVALHVGEVATRAVAREVCTILHRGEAAAKSALQKIMERDAGVVISAAVHAAELQCTGLLYKFISLGVTIRQMCSAAVNMKNITAIEFLVRNMGVAWGQLANDAAVLWIQRDDRSMVDYFATKEPVSWEHALITSSTHGKLEMVQHFISLGAKRVELALDRALRAGAAPNVIEYLCSFHTVAKRETQPNEVPLVPITVDVFGP